MRAAAALLLSALLLAGCDFGAKAVGIEYFKFDYKVSQQPDTTAVVIQGTTDLPDGTYIEVVVARATRAEDAVTGAILIGSSSGPGSVPVQRKKPVDATAPFTIVANRALAETCRRLPPCGPFPAGEYLLLIDVVAPIAASQGPDVLDDSHHRDPMHGFHGGPGLEFTRMITLSPVALKVDDTGRTVSTVPKPAESPTPASPKPVATPTVKGNASPTPTPSPKR